MRFPGRRLPGEAAQVINGLTLLDRVGLGTDEVLVRLRPLAAEAVAVRQAPRWLLWLLHRKVAAITLPWAIYLRPSTLSLPDSVLGRLVVHELVHARQWRELGVVSFTVRYLGEYLRGRVSGLGHWQAYRNISFEREAEVVEGAAG